LFFFRSSSTHKVLYKASPYADVTKVAQRVLSGLSY